MKRNNNIKCPLCGYRFDYEEVCRSRCPLHGRCDLFCCPNCNYTFPRERSGLVDLIKKVFRRRV